MTLDKWQKLSLAEQLGNIGSEISRAKHWQSQNDLRTENNALERAIELVDLTLKDRRWQKRLKEIARLREVLADLMLRTNVYNVSLKNIEKFCLNFAILARKNNQ